MAYVPPEEKDILKQEELPDTNPPLLPLSLNGNGMVLDGARFFSPNWAKGRRGWMIDSDGNAEFNSGVFRGQLKVGGLIINVGVGESIQDALDSVNLAGGGRVVLSPGTHSPGASLTMYSNVSLEGASEGGSIIDFGSGAYSISANGSNVYSTGTIAITSKTTTVTGTTTSWTADMAGRYILLSGIWYPIASVNVGAQTITLAITYAGTTLSAGTSYIISSYIHDVQIKNFTIQNTTSVAVDYRYFNNISIEYMTIINATTGIRMRDGSLSGVHYVATVACGTGMTMNDANTGDVIGYSDTSSTTEGINMTSVMQMSLIDCAITGSTGNGVSMTSCTTISLTTFAAVNCGGKGIELVSGNNYIQIHGGSMVSNTSDGIKLTASSDNCDILNCQLINNGGYGWNIAASTCDTNYAIKNHFSGNTSGKYTNSGTGTFIDEELEITLKKSSDQTVTNNSTLQNDNDFTFSVSANTNYLITLMLFYVRTDAINNANLIFNFSLPTSGTYAAQLSRGDSIAPTSVSQAANATGSNSTTDVVSIITGVVKIGSTAGTVTFQWAENAGNSAIKIYAGSWMKYKILN